MFLRLVKTNFQTSQIFPESPLQNQYLCNEFNIWIIVWLTHKYAIEVLAKKNQQFRFIVKKLLAELNITSGFVNFPKIVRDHFCNWSQNVLLKAKKNILYILYKLPTIQNNSRVNFKWVHPLKSFLQLWLFLEQPFFLFFKTVFED